MSSISVLKVTKSKETALVSHCVKYARMQVFFDPKIPV